MRGHMRRKPCERVRVRGRGSFSFAEEDPAPCTFAHKRDSRLDGAARAEGSQCVVVLALSSNKQKKLNRRKRTRRQGTPRQRRGKKALFTGCALQTPRLHSSSSSSSSLAPAPHQDKPPPSSSAGQEELKRLENTHGEKRRREAREDARKKVRAALKQIRAWKERNGLAALPAFGAASPLWRVAPSGVAA